MKKISVENIENDMILARDVNATSGNTLLGVGTKLSAALGRRLKNWGIDNVYVEGEEEKAPDETTETIAPENLERQLKEKFADVIHIPAMKKIYDTVFEFRVNLGNGGVEQ